MSEKESLIRDTESRKKIISETDKNFFVEAGAGSGKTTMLVNRMVAMVENDIPIGKICAITFTKAAAAEFYDRFQKLLIERSNPDCKWEDKGFAGQLPDPDDITRGRCEKALQNIDLCFMGTIDAFCAMVLSEHPSEAGIPSDNILISDEEAKDFYRKQYVKICKGEYGDELKEMARTFAGFYQNAEEVFAKGMSVFMSNRNVHFNFSKTKKKDIDKAFATDREEIINAVKCMAEHPELKYPAENKNLAAWEKISDTYRSIKRNWSDNFTNIVYALKALTDIRLIPESMDHYGPVFSGLFEPRGSSGNWLDCNVGKEGGVLTKLQNFCHGATMTFLEACVPHLEKAMQDKGYMTYFDYLYYLREMLKEDAGKKDGKLIEHIYERHSYFLIDEFQDTNPLQAEIFFYLTGKDPVSEWTKCKPGPGSLFIVGDPKQSIYRFRGADVTSFLRVKRLFENGVGEVLSLSRNFRSTRKLCEFYNCSFTKILPEENVYQSRFEEIPLPDDKEDEFTGIFTYEAYTGQLKKDHPDKTDPVQIANIIERLVDNDGYLVRTGKDKEPRKIRYSDIMVITYSKKNLGPIMSCLDSRDIPVRVEGQVPFGENESLVEISKIYSAITDPGDKSALYGALTGKIFGFTKNDILIYCKNAGKDSFKSSFDIEGCTDDTACAVAESINKIKSLYYEAVKLSPAAVFSKIMDDQRIYEYIKADKLEVVYYALELIRNAETSGMIISMQDGAAFIKDLVAGKSKEERCLSPDNDRDAVHMANLHKVKGLEAPIVILSAATVFKNKNDKRIEHRDNGSEGYIFNLPKKSDSGSSGGYYFETKNFADKVEEENEAGQAENNRLIYVAATRARNALIIYDRLVKTKNKESHKTIWKDLTEDGLPDFFDSVCDPVQKVRTRKETADAATLYKEAAEAFVLNERKDFENPTYKTENPSRLKLVSKLSDSDEKVIEMDDVGTGSGDKDENKVARTYPALAGTMVHKLMEMLVNSKNKADTTALVDEIIREYRTTETQPYEKKLKKVLSDVAKTVGEGGYPQINPAPQDILNTLLKADEVYCEVPFCYCEDQEKENVLWNGIMDVVYLKDGRWHIIDYKTNADGSDLDKRYQAQLEAYKKAFKATTGEEADALTYHIDV